MGELIVLGKGSEWLWGLLQFVAVATSLFFICRQLRLHSFSNILTSLATLHGRWNSEFMLLTRIRVCEKLVQSGPAFGPDEQVIAEFFEEMGIIVNMRLVPKKVLWETYSWYAEMYFLFFAEGIQRTRQLCKDPTAYTGFEDLARVMKTLSGIKGAPSFEKTTEELASFARSEIKGASCMLNLKQQTHDESAQVEQAAAADVAGSAAEQ